MFLNGLDVNYAPLMEELGLKWITEEGRPLNDSDALLYFFRDKGVNCIRIRIWFGESGPSRLPYATKLAKRAVEAGMWIQPTILLSDSWADLYKQPMPKLWELLPLEERLKHTRSYILRVVEGLKHLEESCAYYQIGNEIDYGICGIFAGSNYKRKRKDTKWLRDHIWHHEAIILKEAIGALKSRCGIPVALHLGKTWDLDLLESFLSAMEAFDVRHEVLCFSFYPAIAGLDLDHLKKLKLLVKDRNKMISIAEYAYPCSVSRGQFWFMNKPSPGYPITLEGQANWIRDFLTHCRKLEFLGAFYWSPELYIAKEPSGIKSPPDMPLGFGWGPMSLFHENGLARPSVNSFERGPCD